MLFIRLDIGIYSDSDSLTLGVADHHLFLSIAVYSRLHVSTYCVPFSPPQLPFTSIPDGALAFARSTSCSHSNRPV